VILIYAFGFAFLCVGIGVALLYNRWVVLQNRFRKAFAEIEVQLKRRHDLIPNLANTARGYLKHERDLLEQLTAARTSAMAAMESVKNGIGLHDPMNTLKAAEDSLTAALGRFWVVAEAYPDLKANQTMLTLMEELTTTENRIAFARQAFNDAVMFFNTSIQTFPANVIAGMFGFHSAEFFEMENISERALPRAFDDSGTTEQAEMK